MEALSGSLGIAGAVSLDLGVAAGAAIVVAAEAAKKSSELRNQHKIIGHCIESLVSENTFFLSTGGSPGDLARFHWHFGCHLDR